MTKGSTDAKRQKFIREMVTVETVAGMIVAYKKAYVTCKKDETARVNAYKLLQIPAIVQAIDKLKVAREELLNEARKKEIEKIAREQVISETQIDAKLSSIIAGTFKRKKKLAAFDRDTGKWHIGTVEEEPDDTAVVSAANLLYKRKGSFAEKKIKHEMGDSFIEMLKVVTAKKQKESVSERSH